MRKAAAFNYWTWACVRFSYQTGLTLRTLRLYHNPLGKLSKYNLSRQCQSAVSELSCRSTNPWNVLDGSGIGSWQIHAIPPTALSILMIKSGIFLFECLLNDSSLAVHTAHTSLFDLILSSKVRGLNLTDMENTLKMLREKDAKSNLWKKGYIRSQKALNPHSRRQKPPAHSRCCILYMVKVTWLSQLETAHYYDDVWYVKRVIWTSIGTANQPLLPRITLHIGYWTAT